jgi:hypothetical protein
MVAEPKFLRAIGSSKSSSLGGGGGVSSLDQPSLFRKRISTPLPGLPNGKDIGFRCFVEDGALYYCKDDKNGRPLRAIEWICTQLADHMGVSVADCAVIEDNEGSTYFGSRSPRSVADTAAVGQFMGAPATGELGQPLPWLGQYLARLFAFDLFIDNPDRSLCNFILDRDTAPRRLRAIDFASARLMHFSVERFPVESDATVWVGRAVRKVHGRHVESAMEMPDWLAAVPVNEIEKILGQMPEDWLSLNQREGLSGFWSDGRRHDRIARLRAFLRHESQV